MALDVLRNTPARLQRGLKEPEVDGPLGISIHAPRVGGDSKTKQIPGMKPV